VTEESRILATLSPSERRIYARLGGTLPRPAPAAEWARPDLEGLRCAADAKRSQRLKRGTKRRYDARRREAKPRNAA
jgi:hypothetical protein